MRTVIRKLREEAGAEILEAALVLPILFMFLLGIVWFGRAFNIYSTITQAAQQGAIAAARPTCATCLNTLTADAQVVGVITSVLQASHLDPTLIPVNSKAPTAGTSLCPSAPAPVCATTSGNITICRSVVLNPAGATDPVQCGAIVSFQYPFQLHVPFTSLNQITLTAQAQTRMEN
jgi:Flp pilus assembly protein TadG